MVKNIIFDLGGVILKHRNNLMEKILAKMFTLPYDKAGEIWKENKEPLIIGRENSRQFLKKLKKLLQCNLTVDQLLMAWKTEYKKETAGVNLELINFIELLRENIAFTYLPIQLISMINIIHKETSITNLSKSLSLTRRD